VTIGNAVAGAIPVAVLAGILVGVSRQVNGRLSLSTSPLVASFWNHAVGFALLSVVGLAAQFLFGPASGGWRLVPPGAHAAPWHAFAGGPIGVVFVALGSWLLEKIGSLNSALLVIGGQMVSGVALDVALGNPSPFAATALGVLLILCGVALTQRRRRLLPPPES
jgi:bacterial/archaeal transporter family-2 protein